MSRAAKLKVFLAGRVALERGRVVVDEKRFPGRQGRLLFAYFVAEEGRPVPRDELADALWGDTPPATWEKALTVLVSKLRGLLTECGVDGATALTSAFGCYRLELPEGTWVDVTAAADLVAEAEAALAAEDLDRARAVAEEGASLARPLFLSGEEGDWVEAKRRELSDILVRALSCLTEASFRSGDSAAAANWAEETIALEPYRETGYRQLMAAHAAAGNRAEALRVYERCRQLLATELGAYPSPETESIYRELLEEPAREPRGAAPQAAPVQILEREQLVSEAPTSTAARRRRPRHMFTYVALAGVIAAAVAIPLFALDGGASRVDLGDPSKSVGVLDASSGEVTDAVELAAAPTAIAAGLRYVWAASADSNAVYAIDPETNTVHHRIDVESAPGGIAIGGDYVWVTNSLTGTVSQIDPEALIVVQKISVGNGPTGVAVGGGHVWVTNALDHTVSKIRASTGKLLGTYRGGTDPGAVAYGEGAVWVASKSGDTVIRLNPRNGQQLRKINVGHGPATVKVGLGSVWVANSDDGTLMQIDPESDSIVHTEKVGSNPSDIGIVRGEVWTTNELDGTVSRVDPANWRTTTRQIGGRPSALAAGDGSAYVALRPTGAAHRGGTLRVALLNIDPLGTTFDPAIAFFIGPFLSLTGDGLLGYRQVEGEAGNELVPDLAVDYPYVSPDGKTYRFQLRQNVHYSNGKLVQASDVRYTFERVFRLEHFGPGWIMGTFRGIRGAKSCKPHRCNLSAGIVTDDEARTVTFHLYAPDPDFRYKLAFIAATIVPAGTPMHPAKRRPVPATGPYRIAGFTPNQSIRLVRNPRFHEWSNAAQPAGFPDEVVGEVVPGPSHPDTPPLRLRWQKKRIALVERGEADLTSSHGAIPFSSVVSAPFLSRVHRYPIPVVFYLAFNTNRPPFNDPRARQAVNYALDRNRVVLFAGGEDSGQPTCQVLPPNFPARRRYCPYTRDRRADESWTAPDLTRATELVAASGTARRPVTLWIPRAIAGIGLGRYLEELLESLGYRVHLRSSFKQRIICSGSPPRCEKMSPAGAYFNALPRNPQAAPQILWGGWAADYPAASNFIEPLFSCGASENYTHLCDRALDRHIRRALRLQRTDIVGANRLWTELDREITNKALWVPLYSVNGADLVSKRVGNYRHHPMEGALLSQLWVR
jgi:peptide/nickel transport system substrate-binding protein